MGDLQRLVKLLENFEKVKSEVIDGIGQIAVTEFTLNFRKESFNGVSWKQKQKPNGKKILVNRGILNRSIHVTKKTSDTITIGSNVPYAYIHNNGGKIKINSRTELFSRNRYKTGKNKGKFKKGTTSGKGHTIESYIIDMPQRQFMGDMPSLTKKITAFIKRKFENIDK